MTNLEMLLFGMQHIAENHGFNADVNYEENDYQVCVWGGCNVPTLSDVEMLCEDVHIERGMIRSGDCGIDVYFSTDWWENWAHKEYESGLEMWKRAC